MFKKRLFLIVTLLSLLLGTLAMSGPSLELVNSKGSARPVVVPGTENLSDSALRHSELSASAEITAGRTSDFYQRHLEWAGSIKNPVMSVTDDSDYLDYYQRHSELRELSDEDLTTTPLDECFDVSLSEVAACREASQASAP